METVNLGEKFSRIHDSWNPRIAGELNDSSSTLNTGNVVDARTVRQEERI